MIKASSLARAVQHITSVFPIMVNQFIPRTLSFAFREIQRSQGKLQPDQCCTSELTGGMITPGYLSVNSWSDIFFILSLQSCILYPTSCLSVTSSAQPSMAVAGALQLPGCRQLERCLREGAACSHPSALPGSTRGPLPPWGQRELQPDAHCLSNIKNNSPRAALGTAHSAFRSFWRKGKGFHGFRVRAPMFLLSITAQLNASVELVHYYCRTKPLLTALMALLYCQVLS